MRKEFTFLTLSCAVVFLSGCNIAKTLQNSLEDMKNAFTSPTVPVSYVKPANISGAEKIRRIAVMEQRNDGAVSFLESNLSGITVNSSPYFTLVDRSTLEKAIKEQKFTESLLADNATRVKLGKFTGADTIVSGTLGANINSTHYSKTVSKCSDKKCKNTYDATVQCTKHTAVAVFEPKAVSVETGRILFSKNYTRSVDTDACNGEGDALLSDSELRGRAYAIIAEDFKADVAPYTYTVDVELFESDDSDMPEKADKYFDMGIELAENKRVDNACMMFAKAQSEFNKSVALAFNNGVCAEYAGDIEKANAFYHNAETLTDDVDELKYIILGEERLKSRQTDTETLSQLSGVGRI